MAVIEIEAICPVADHVRLGTDFSTTSNTLADVSGMSFVLEENSFYWIEVFGFYTTAATTTGLRLGATVPSGTSATYQLLYHGNAAGTGVAAAGGALAGTVVNAQTAESAQGSIFKSLFYVATGAESGSPSTGIVGTFQLQFATEAGGSNATLKAGTAMRLMKFEQAAATAAVTLQDPGFNASYSVSDTTFGASASASLTLTYLDDGTWTLASEPDDNFFSGTPTSGNWGTPTTAGAGSNYELRITSTGQSGGAVSNDATDWTPITPFLRARFTVVSTGGSSVGTVTFTAEVRQRGTTSIGSTGSFTATVTANAES